MPLTTPATVTFDAAVWRGGSDQPIEELRLLPLGDSDVLVRVEACNVSSSDGITVAPENLAFAVPLPQVLGHAMSGVVEQIGAAVTRVRVGDTVIATSTPECGVCWFCVRGRSAQCARSRFVGDPHALSTRDETVSAATCVGGFAELTVVPEVQVTPIETTVPFAQLALLAGGFGSGLGAGLRISPIEVGSVACAVGLGVSGLGFVQAARIAGARMIIGIDPIADRRELALQLGATHVIDPTASDPVQAVHLLGGDYGGLQGAGADFVFDSSGTVVGMAQAWEMARATASVVMSSVPNNMSSSVSFPAVPFACFSKTVYSSQFGNLSILRDLPWAVRLVEDAQLDLAPICTAEYTLDQVEQAIADASAHVVLGATVFPTRPFART